MSHELALSSNIEGFAALLSSYAKNGYWLIAEVIRHKEILGHVVHAIAHDMALRITGIHKKPIARKIFCTIPVLLSMEKQLNSAESKERMMSNLRQAFESQLAVYRLQAKAEDEILKGIVSNFVTDCTTWDIQLIPASAEYLYEQKSLEDEGAKTHKYTQIAYHLCISCNVSESKLA
jgi:hypothetical protein